MKYLIVFFINIVLTNKTICQINSIQQLNDKLIFLQQDSSRSKIYSELSVLYIDNWYNSNFQNVNQLDSALYYSVKSEQLLLKNKSIPNSYKIWNKLGSIYMELYHHESNIKLRKKAINKGISIDSIVLSNANIDNDSTYIKIALFNLSLKFAAISDINNFFNSSLKLIYLINNKPENNNVDSMILLRIYNFYCYFLKYDKNPYYYNKFLSETEKILPNHLSTKLLILEKHSIIWKLDKENTFLQEYNSIKKECQIEEQILTSNNLVSSYYYNNNEYNKSIEIYKNPIKDIDETSSSSLKNILGFKYFNLGRCAFKLNNSKKALYYLNKSLNFYNQSKDSIWSEKYLTLEYLSDVYQKLGNYKKALYYNIETNKVHKQLQDIQILFSIADNDIKIEQTKRDKKLQLFQTQTLLKEQEANLQNRLKKFFILLSILTTLSLAFATYNFFKKKMLSDRLVIKNSIIVQQSEALKESNVLKDKIFALISHDLRAPINRLIMNINQNYESKEQYINSELKGIQDILNNVLYWASMQLKGITPLFSNLPLKTAINSVMKEYLFELNAKNLTFINRVDRNFNLQSDEIYLKIILRNIISNAIKFTKENGYILVDSKVENEIVQIIIRDTGIGISSEKINKIFKLFESSTGTKKEKGSGLGLSLSLDIAKKLNGNIEVFSKENEGTDVIITIPNQIISII